MTRTPMPKGYHLLSRRSFLSDIGCGLSSIGLAQLLNSDGLLAADRTPLRPVIDPANPNAQRAPHFAAKAKNVLVIFCAGACSQVETFDYKPELISRHGQPMAGGDQLLTFQGQQGNLTKSPWEFKPRGESGKMVSAETWGHSTVGYQVRNSSGDRWHTEISGRQAAVSPRSSTSCCVPKVSP